MGDNVVIENIAAFYMSITFGKGWDVDGWADITFRSDDVFQYTTQLLFLY